MNDGLIVEILELGPYFTNCYIVGDGESRKGVIIDPAWDPDRIKSAVEKLDLVVERIVLTHGHADHIAALSDVHKYFNAPVLVGERDSIMLTDPDANLSGMTGQVIHSDSPDKVLRDGDIVSVGKYEFRVLETPGHTPGSISLYGHGVVFTGDALFLGSIGRTDFPGSSHETLISSIHEKLLALPDDTIIYPGHGPDSTIGQEREFNPFLI